MFHLISHLPVFTLITFFACSPSSFPLLKNKQNDAEEASEGRRENKDCFSMQNRTDSTSSYCKQKYNKDVQSVEMFMGT